MSDAQLLELGRAGDDEALAILLRRYRGFVRAKARVYFLVGGDHEDVVQEGMVGLYKAMRDFDPGQRTSFRGFAELCVVRQIISAVKTATRHKHSPLNAYVSIHGRADDGERPLADVLRSPSLDPEQRVVSAAELARTRAELQQSLSELEADVLRRYLAGQSYQEIAGALQRQVKSIDNALQRIKRKLDVYLSERRSVEGV